MFQISHLLSTILDLLSLKSLLLIFILFIIGKIFFIPYWRISFYKSQGLESHFFPILGMFLTYQQDVQSKGFFWASLRARVKKNPNQKCIVSNFGSNAILHLHNPVLLRDFFSKPQNYTKELSFLGLAGSVLAYNAISLVEGQEWKFQRSIISNIFHYQFLQEQTPMIQQITAKHFSRLADSGNLNHVQLVHVFQNLAGEILSTLFFGTSIEGKTIHGKSVPIAVADFNKELFVLAQDPLNLLFGPIYTKLGLSGKVRDAKRRILEFRAFLRNIIRERRETMKTQSKSKIPDLIGLLLEKQAEFGEKQISDDTIVSNFVTFFGAGVETIANAVTMLCYLLNENPDIKQNMETEINKTYSDNITLETLNKMEYTAACFQESMRLLGPGKHTFVRVTAQDHMLGDIKVKKGTLIFPELEAHDYNPMHYSEPEKFVPERWVQGGSNEKDVTYHFSSGPRNCVGKQLALIESKIFVAEFLRKFSFKVADGYKLRMTLRATHEPVDEVPFDLKKK